MFDHKEFKEMFNNYSSVANDLEAFLIDFLIENARWLKGQTKERTPVDSGNLRRKWHVSRAYKLSNGNYGFILMNDEDYASFVENGHTTRNRKGWVDGYYMATISITKLEERWPRRFDKEFVVFLASHGVR